MAKLTIKGSYRGSPVSATWDRGKITAEPDIFKDIIETKALQEISSGGFAENLKFATGFENVCRRLIGSRMRSIWLQGSREEFTEGKVY